MKKKKNWKKKLPLVLWNWWSREKRATRNEHVLSLRFSFLSQITSNSNRNRHTKNFQYLCATCRFAKKFSYDFLLAFACREKKKSGRECRKGWFKRTTFKAKHKEYILRFSPHDTDSCWRFELTKRRKFSPPALGLSSCGNLFVFGKKERRKSGKEEGKRLLTRFQRGMREGEAAALNFYNFPKNERRSRNTIITS